MYSYEDLEPDDPEKPVYHIMPRNGWMNDPNGPIFYDGQYHMFYQHVQDGCEWDFGIVWGHVVSSDLTHWERLPLALEPSFGGLDADGCFSGCAVVDTDGTPTILYTGVRLRSNPDCGPLPPPQQDLNLPFVESQLVATAKRSGDQFLRKWHKQRDPMIALPPAGTDEGAGIVGWRDPFVFEFKGQNGHERWGILMGSGRKTTGGAVMIYRSDDLCSGWEFEGWLCEADNVNTGLMWECPLLAPLEWVREAPTARSHSNLQPITESDLSGRLSGDEPVMGSHLASEGTRRELSNAAEGIETSAQAKEARADGTADASVDDLVQHFGELRTVGAEARGPESEQPQSHPHPHPMQHADRAPPQHLSSSPADPGLRVKLQRSSAASSRRTTTDDEPGSPSQASQRGAADGLQPGSGGSSLRSSPLGSPTAAAYQRRKRHSEDRQRYTHLLCISPDAPTNPVLYFLGNMAQSPTKFLLDGAKGPINLDLGDVLYAPNFLVDGEGRYLLWGWLQERRKVGSYDYAGCLSVPRIMRLRGDRLVQEPAPEVDGLRRDGSMCMRHVTVQPEASTPLLGCYGSLALDITLQLERVTATAAGVLVRSWQASEGDAAIVFDWERKRLEVVYEPPPGDQGEGTLNLASSFSLEGEERRVGGEVDLRPGDTLEMRILLDHSCVEVFLSTGEVLSTRIYRGAPSDPDPSIEFVAFGGSALIPKVEAWEVSTIWEPRRSLSKRGFTEDAEAAWDPLAALMPPVSNPQQPLTVGGF